MPCPSGLGCKPTKNRKVDQNQFFGHMIWLYFIKGCSPSDGFFETILGIRRNNGSDEPKFWITIFVHRNGLHPSQGSYFTLVWIWKLSIDWANSESIVTIGSLIKCQNSSKNCWQKLFTDRKLMCHKASFASQSSQNIQGVSSCSKTISRYAPLRESFRGVFSKEIYSKFVRNID